MMLSLSGESGLTVAQYVGFVFPCALLGCSSIHHFYPRNVSDNGKGLINGTFSRSNT